MLTLTTPDRPLAYSANPQSLAREIVNRERENAHNFIRVSSRHLTHQQRQIDAANDCIGRLRQHIASLLAENWRLEERVECLEREER